MRFVRWAALPSLVCVVLVASGAGFARTTAKHSVRAVTGSQTFTVNVDGVNPKANESFLAYFPRNSTVHAGDTVVFHYVGVGEPHTVTLGTLADNAVSVNNHLTPAQQQSNVPPPAMRAADALLPQLFPQGPGDAVASAADPCFMQSGDPGSNICPNSQHQQPDFNGSQSYYNSGWLDANQKFTVKLSSSTPAGTYRFFCLLHREFMSGKITVVPSSKTIESPSTQYALGQKQQARMEAALAPAVAALRQGKPPVPKVTLPPDSVLAGSAGNVPAQIDEFGPKTVKIAVGGSVTLVLPRRPHDHVQLEQDRTTTSRLNAPDGTRSPQRPGARSGRRPRRAPPASGPTTGLHLKIVA